MSLLAGAFRGRGARRLRRRRPASRWRWRRPSPASASATPACTSRTPTPTRSPAGSATTGPRATRRTSRSCRTAWRSRCTAPEAFRFTFEAAPERHLRAARLLDPTATGDGPDVLPGVLSALMRDIGIPNGLAEVGYGEADVDDLVAGAMQQQRLLATAPRRPRRRTSRRCSVARWNTGEVSTRPPRPGRGAAPTGGRRRRRLDADPGALLLRRLALPRGARRSVARPRHADELLAVLDASRATRRAADHARRRHVDRRQRGRARASWSTPSGTSARCCRDRPRGAHRRRPAGRRCTPILQRAAAPHGLRFGPDPSTHTRCTIGGMIGNNACGSRALGYGRTVDNVAGLAVAFGTGEVAELGPARRRPSSTAAVAGWSSPTSTSRTCGPSSAGSPAR